MYYQIAHIIIIMYQTSNVEVYLKTTFTNQFQIY